MNCRDYEKLLVRFEGNRAPEEGINDIEIDEKVGKVIRDKPSWFILPENCLVTKTNVTQVFLYPIEDQIVYTRQIMVRMAKSRLRPVTVREFMDIVKGMPVIDKQMVCLGTMWGKLGREIILIWRNNKAQLAGIDFRWEQNTVFPAVHHCGHVNPLPGVVY